MMRICMLLTVFLMYSGKVRSQNVFLATDFAGFLAAQYDPGLSDPLHFTYNPSVVSSAAGLSTSLIAEKKYSVAGLYMLSIASMYSDGANAGGLSGRLFGGPGYSEFTAHARFGKSLGKVSIGAGIDHLQLAIQGSRRQHLTAITAGSTWRIQDNVFLSITGYGTPVKVGNVARHAAQQRFGIGYRISPEAYIGVEVIKQEGRKAFAVSNLFYRFSEKVFCQAGVSVGLQQWRIGLGWANDNFQSLILLNHHSPLGLSPVMVMHYGNNKTIAD